MRGCIGFLFCFIPPLSLLLSFPSSINNIILSFLYSSIVCFFLTFAHFSLCSFFLLLVSLCVHVWSLSLFFMEPTDGIWSLFDLPNFLTNCIYERLRWYLSMPSNSTLVVLVIWVLFFWGRTPFFWV
jgi:hypothetical protein